MKILIPLDGTPLSESVIPRALAMAGRWNAEVILVRSSDPFMAVAPDLSASITAKLQLRSLAAATEYLEEVSQRFKGLKVNCHQPLGLAREEIARIALHENCQLIIMASHGRKGSARWLLGSVAEGVLRRTRCPILLLRPPASDAPEFRRILVPVDGSQDSLEVLHRIGPYLAPGGKVTVIQSSEPPEDIAVPYLDQIQHELRQLKVDGLELEARALQGGASEAILSWAQEHDCDLIAMSTHGRTGVRGPWIGSVTEKVARYSQCPVLAFPRRQED